MPDPVTGPLSRDELKVLADAPFGAATKAIRKHDPLWGRVPGETFEWDVRATRTTFEVGRATVEAESQEEADRLADELTDDDFSWHVSDCDADDFIIETVKIAK